MAKKQMNFKCKLCDGGGPYEKIGSMYRHLFQAHDIEKVKVKKNKHYGMTNRPAVSSSYKPRNSTKTNNDKNLECLHCENIYKKKQQVCTHISRKHNISPAIEGKDWKYTNKMINTIPYPSRKQTHPGKKPGQVISANDIKRTSLIIPMNLVIPLEIGIPMLEEQEIETQTIVTLPIKNRRS